MGSKKWVLGYTHFGVSFKGNHRETTHFGGSKCSYFGTRPQECPLVQAETPKHPFKCTWDCNL